MVEDTYTWHGSSLRLSILHSWAGVAQQIWLEHDRRGLLLDCGDGTLRDLLRHHIDLQALDAVLITHGHFDHVGGLHSLLGFMRMVGRKRTLHIVAPRHCRELSEITGGFDRSYGGTIPFDLEQTRSDGRQTMALGPWLVESIPVVHCGSIAGGEILDQIPAVGYRITAAGETVAITGDSGMCEALKELVRDADLAIIEATFGDDHEIPAEVLERVHLNERLANELGRLARDYRLVHRVMRTRL